MKKLLFILLVVVLTAFSQKYTFNTLAELEFNTVGVFAGAIATMNDSIIVIIDGADMRVLEVDSDMKNPTQIDSIRYKTSGSARAIVKISATKVMIAFSVSGTEYVATYSFDGSWAPTIIDEITYVGYSSVDMALMDATHVFAFEGDTNNGRVFSFSFDGAGDNIVNINILSVEADGLYPTIFALDDTTAVVAFFGSAADNQIITVDSDAAFDNLTEISRVEGYIWAEAIGMAQIDGTHVIIAESQSSPFTTHYIKTISMDAAFDNLAIVDTHQDAVPAAGSAAGNKYLSEIGTTGDFIVVKESNNIPNVRSYNVDGSYVVTDNADSTRFTALTNYVFGYKGDQLNDNTFVVMWSEDVTYDGYIAIIEAELTSAGWSHTIDGVASPTEINAVTDWTKIDGVE